MDSFTAHGTFWLADAPDLTATGILTFDRDAGANLTLIGNLSGDFSHVGAAPTMIHGETEGGDVTLLDCFLTNRTSRSRGGRDVWRPQALLVGACLADTDLRFDNAYYEVDGLLEWASRNGIRRHHTTDESGVIIGISLEVEQIESTTVALPDGGTLLVQFPASSDGDGSRAETLTRTARLHRTWVQPEPLAVITSEIRAFEHLMTIATHEGCSHRTITLQHPDVVVAAGSRTYREPIVFHAATVSKPVTSVPHRSSMMFRMEDLGGTPGLANWIDVASAHSRALALVTSVRYQPGLYGENKLLNTTTGAEALHRKLLPGKAIDDDTFADIRRAMLDAAPAENRSHLGMQINHANEHFLTRRLRDLAEFCAPASAAVVGDPKRWARAVAALRNDLTHVDGDVQPGDQHGADLLLISESVYTISVLCLLKSAGLDDAALANVTQTPTVQWCATKIPGIVDRLLGEP